MPRLSVRITESQEAELESRAQGEDLRVSQYVRFLLFHDSRESLEDRLEALEGDVRRLEELAGL